MQVAVRQAVPMQPTRQPPQCAGQLAAEARRVGVEGPLFRAREPLANNLVERSGVLDLARDEKAFADDEASRTVPTAAATVVSMPALAICAAAAASRSAGLPSIALRASARQSATLKCLRKTVSEESFTR